MKIKNLNKSKKAQITQNMVVGGIIVLLILGIGITWMINEGNINNWLKMLPQYDAPESKEMDFTDLSDEQIRSICPEVVGYVSKARKNKINFIDSFKEDVSDANNYPFKSEFEFKENKGIIKVNDELWVNPLTKDSVIAEINERNINVSKYFFNKAYQYDFQKEDYFGLKSYRNLIYKLRKLDGAYKIPGGVLICRIEKSELQKNIEKQLEDYEKKKCKIDEDYKVISDKECYCLDSDASENLNIEKLNLEKFSCNKGEYCYEDFLGCEEDRLWSEGKSAEISLIITAWKNDKLEFSWNYQNDYGVVLIYPNKKTPYKYTQDNADDLVKNRFLLKDINKKYLEIIKNILSAEDKCDFVNRILENVNKNDKIILKDIENSKSEIMKELYDFSEIPEEFCDY